MVLGLDLFKFFSLCAEIDLYYQPVTEKLSSAVFEVWFCFE